MLKLRAEAGKPLRRRLPDTRAALTHKFDIAGHEGYLTVGLFEDGQPGELFITMAKEGSTIGGLMDSIGTLTSMALQYGVPLEALVQEIRASAVRAVRLHEESGDSQRVVHHRLRLPLAGVAIHSRLPRKPSTPRATSRNWPCPACSKKMKKKVNRPVPELPIAEDNRTSWK